MPYREPDRLGKIEERLDAIEAKLERTAIANAAGRVDKLVAAIEHLSTTNQGLSSDRRAQVDRLCLLLERLANT